MSLNKNDFFILKIVCFFILVSIIGCKSMTKTTGIDISSKPDVLDVESYRNIRSNIARVQAMLVGEFVQHTRVGNEDEYKTWMVNDKQDSVMLYSIPVAEPNKNGYWLYHYQIMTSLPDEPIYEVFEKLIEVDRDSIKSVYYLAPKDFNLPLNELIKKHENSFSDIKFDELEMDEDGGYYIRQNALFFKSQTAIEKGPKSFYIEEIYNVYPNQIVFATVYYKDAEGKKFHSQEVSKFVKLSVFD